jgi:hypothetical protein
MKIQIFLSILNLNLLAIAGVMAQIDNVQKDIESDYYQIAKVPIPEGVILEVGGMCSMPDGSIAVSTRRGEIYVVTP